VSFCGAGFQRATGFHPVHQPKAGFVASEKSPCSRIGPLLAWDQRPFCLAFFSRLGKRDLFFLANFGIFVDFLLGAIGSADSAAASGTAAFFPAPLSAAFVPLAEPSSIVPFFLSAIPSSGPAEFPEIRIRG
jgi:hypothetical protein